MKKNYYEEKLIKLLNKSEDRGQAIQITLEVVRAALERLQPDSIHPLERREGAPEKDE